MKTEELVRRADDKQRQIQEYQKKMGMRSRSPSPVKGGNTMAGLDIYETQSEFSVMSTESELKVDENILDFVIEDAEYYYDSFSNVLSDKEV